MGKTLREVLGPELVKKGEAINAKAATRQQARAKKAAQFPIVFDLEMHADQIHLVRGSFATDDPAVDRADEDEIIRRFNEGDDWAWANVRVRAVSPLTDIVGYSGWLGGCTYANEKDFRSNSGYFEDMCYEAAEDLKKKLKMTVRDGKKAAEILSTL